ncbi:MAG: glycoside hydrolase family 38 C-terminal domain-containing protein [Paludibacter sp.]
MKTKITFIFGLLLPLLAFSQPFVSPTQYDIEKDKVLYTVGYAHLDTEWNWDYPSTINVCIKNTMEENFRLFEKYPDYVFNFTGSRRYRFMKEYYPEMYPKVKEYIQKGRWHVSGSSVDEGEVNVSSSESVLRQVLYGNLYFKKEFGKTSVDYMLPDCFGFLSNLPTVWNHAGLLGFSTQKLTWNSASGLPFNVGVWNGPDGKGIIAALNATDYSGNVRPRLDMDTTWIIRINENYKKYGFNFDYRYYGVGDEGGAPRENDVINAVGSLKNKDSKIKVVLTSSDQLYKDITPVIRKKLPVFMGDLLLTEHSAGSMTSQAYMKRMNRKNELLAQSAEQTAVIADWLGGADYPFTKLNNAWNLVLGSQFHDILPGTSIQKAYEYAWNDEFVAANGFSAVLKNSLKVISNTLNTNTVGRSLVVYNPVATAREDVVTAELTYATMPENIAVFDKNGKELTTQILENKGTKIKFIFVAQLPSTGAVVFDVRETTAKSTTKTSLKITSQTIENEFYTVIMAANGDIESIFDKKLKKEILAKPARLEFLKEVPSYWPAWNMDWADRKNAPIDFMDKEAQISILENGPVRVSLIVKRKGLNSEIEQVVSLAAGASGKRVEISNVLDWQSKGVSLKASFPFTASNSKAAYNLGVGVINRTNNDSLKFEVPAKEWMDLTDNSGKFGVSILEDCKYGSDKPTDNTLRLTLMFTPGISKSADWCWYQGFQDWGIHEFKYGIYSHSGDWAAAQTAWQAKFLNQPLVAFETSKHEGVIGKEMSILKTNSPQIGIMALKKMEEGDYSIVRANELTGKDAKAVTISFPTNIVDAYEVNGQEVKIGNADFKNGKLNFDVGYFGIKSFAVKFEKPIKQLSKPQQEPLVLPYNYDMITNDMNRWDCMGTWGNYPSYPAEEIPAEIVSEDIRFEIKNTADRLNNTVVAAGQTINLPQNGATKVYVLAAADDDTQGEFIVDGKSTSIKIQSRKGFVGQFFKPVLNALDSSVFKIESAYYKSDNIAFYASHTHKAYPSENQAYQYCYMYKYAIVVPQNAKTLTLPTNKKIKIFAITAVKNETAEIDLATAISDDFSNSSTAKLRK